MVRPVEVVRISKIIPIFKDNVEATNICVVNFKFSNGDECGYNVVTQKSLYEIGSEAVYIQPDYCLSDLPIFDSFIRPGGDERKSKLGKNFRIRAIKFNFQLEGTSSPVYSFGILLPKNEVDAYVNAAYEADALADILGITKYEEPESAGSGMSKGTFPSFLYKTDEENCNNIKGHIEKVIESGEDLSYSVKVDGSSFTLYVKKDDSGAWTHGICSRTFEKKTDQFYVSNYVDDSGLEYHKYIHPETKVKGWFCDATLAFKTDEEVSGYRPVLVEVKDSWVDLATKLDMVEKLKAYCQKYDVQLALRGELYGSGLKGSGNKLNPHANEKQNIMLFGVDRLDSGFAVRQHQGDEHNLVKVCDELGLNFGAITLISPSSYEDLIRIADSVFEDFQSKGKTIEGIVVRTLNSNNLSTKVMNPVYDAKK